MKERLERERYSRERERERGRERDRERERKKETIELGRGKIKHAPMGHLHSGPRRCWAGEVSAGPRIWLRGLLWLVVCTERR